MHDNPLISIIMNCYNGERYINEAIDSVYAQSYSNWEIIFWDNASTDNSYLIASKYDSKISKFKAEKNTSLGEARNRAVSHANGEWLAFLDVDDIWLPKKLEIQLKGLLQNNHLLSYGGIKEVDKDLNIIRELPARWRTGQHLKLQLLYFEINLVSSMVNRNKLVELGLNFDPEMQASEEYNLYMRLLPYGTVHVCEDTIALYRVHNESLTYEKLDRLAIERRLTLEELAKTHPSVTSLSEYNSAKRQADYYEACSLMSKQNTTKARNLLRKHVGSPIFLVIYLMSFFPIVWKFCHDPVTKKKLTGLIKLNQ